jgi:hypothetical protein
VSAKASAPGLPDAALHDYSTFGEA